MQNSAVRVMSGLERGCTDEKRVVSSIDTGLISSSDATNTCHPSLLLV